MTPTLWNSVRLVGMWGYFSLTTVLCDLGIIILTSGFRKMSLKEVRRIATGHTTSSDRARLQPPTWLTPCGCLSHRGPRPFPSPPVSPALHPSSSLSHGSILAGGAHGRGAAFGHSRQLCAGGTGTALTNVTCPSPVTCSAPPPAH